MTVSREVEAEIQRLSHAEGWPPGTIAKELSVFESLLHGPASSDSDEHTENLFKGIIRQMGEQNPLLRIQDPNFDKLVGVQLDVKPPQSETKAL